MLKSLKCYKPNCWWIESLNIKLNEVTSNERYLMVTSLTYANGKNSKVIFDSLRFCTYILANDFWCYDQLLNSF
jgi:hypothetical protein